MKQVKRYPVAIEPEQVIKMPYNSRILDLSLLNDKPTMWVLCDPDNSGIDRTFVTVGPEKEVDRRLNETNFIGSYEAKAEVGTNVLHVFEKT